MMTDPRSLGPDPRAALHADPRPPCDPRSGLSDARGLMSVCGCGLPSCPRTPHPAPQGMTLAPEGHLAATHGMSGIPLGAAPVGHVDPALLYQMGAAYGFSDSPEVLRSLPQFGGYYPYDPSTVYPYVNGYAGIDARRKNATKESTNTLKAWLFEHRKNPYPTKGEKIMLAILTKMTLTQVSTWFANARRRLKKENKVTWVTKDDDMDDDDDDDDVNSEHNSEATDRGHVTGSGSATESLRHHGSVGDDDDNMSMVSGGERSEIDVEENSDSDLDHEDADQDCRRTRHPLSAILIQNNGQLAQAATSSPTDQSNRADNELKTAAESNSNDSSSKRTANHSFSEQSSANLSPITPPPSPKEVKVIQSTPSSHSSSTRVHQSTATIHHHPVTSANTSSSSSPSSSSPSSSSTSPSKPKIWSIADVVSAKDDVRVDNKLEVTSSRPHPFSKCIGAPSAIVSLGGAAVRAGAVQHGVVLPGSDVPYSLTYYPYALPHATAMMASQVTSHVRLPHPYALQGHPSAPHLVAPTSGFERPLVGQSGYFRSGSQLPPSCQTNVVQDLAVKRENDNKSGPQGQLNVKCSTSVFMPVTQRQV